MAVMLMAKAFNIKVGNAGKKLVLLKLADNANDKGECWPSYQHIADQCEISKRSAMNYINSLIDDGLIRKQVRKGPKGNSTNVYVLSLGGENAAPHGANGSPPSERAAPPSERAAPPSERAAPPSERAAPGGSEPAAPGISHSFESVNESVTSASDESDLPSAEFVSLICKDGTEYKVDPGYLQEIIKLHPRVDVTAELQAMRAWLLSNPGKRKTGAGMKRFINSWLTRAAQTTDRPRGNVRDFQSYQGQSQPAPRPRKLFPGINHAPLPSRASTGGEA